MISQIAASAYATARQAIAPAAGTGGSGVSLAADRFAQVMENADRAAQGAMMGTTSTQDLVQAIAESQLALETAVSIRDKVVEAYQDILRMPV